MSPTPIQSKRMFVLEMSTYQVRVFGLGFQFPLLFVLPSVDVVPLRIFFRVIVVLVGSGFVLFTGIARIGLLSILAVFDFTHG